MVYRKIKCVVFDLDGTLVDAYRAVAFSVNGALRDLGFSQVDDYSIQRSVGWGEKKLLSIFVPAEELEKTHSIYREYNRKALQSMVKFLPGAKKLLEGLKEQGFKLAVATNRPSYSTQIILKRLKIIQYFDAIVCPEDVLKPKPFADSLNKIMHRFSLNTDELVFVGDMTVDAETGKNAGVKTVVISTGSSTKEELLASEPFKVIERLSEIPAIIINLNIQEQCDIY